MIKAKVITAGLLISLIYMTGVLKFWGVSSNMGKRGMGNYLLRGTAFLPAGIFTGILLICLITLYLSHVRGRGSSAGVKLPFWAAGLILMLLFVWSAAMSVCTISNYRYDTASEPQEVILSEAVLVRKPATGRKYSVSTGAYSLIGKDGEGNQKGFWLSKMDAAHYMSQLEGNSVRIKCYPRSRVILDISPGRF